MKGKAAGKKDRPGEIRMAGEKGKRDMEAGGRGIMEAMITKRWLPPGKGRRKRRGGGLSDEIGCGVQLY